MKSYTDIEQSKKLVGLGLNPTTADMYYEYVDWKDVWVPGLYSEFVDRKVDKELKEEFFNLKRYEPCWSVGRLMGLMCEGKDYDISTSFGGWEGENLIEEWFCTYETESGDIEKWEYHSTHDKTLIGACYKMIIWLIKNKKLTPTS